MATLDELINRMYDMVQDAKGIPLAGAVGGVLDSRLTARLLDYAALKYNRRFLLDHRPAGAAGL